MSSRVQNLITILGIVVLAGLGYYLFVQNDSLSLNTSNQEVSNQAAAETAEFLRRLNQLKEIDLDDTIFTDPRFTSLINFTEPIQPEPIGRTNPFEEVN